ncbi:hypothetical protein EZS27_008511 [termite gut metagenome]|uniref:Uncharacterized protein n=1 Tax=termite gut metagenome TaxID=433724 RepID=A0A5J4SCL6_9ZZZZ
MNLHLHCCLRNAENIFYTPCSANFVPRCNFYRFFAKYCYGNMDNEFLLNVSWLFLPKYYLSVKL